MVLMVEYVVTIVQDNRWVIVEDVVDAVVLVELWNGGLANFNPSIYFYIFYFSLRHSRHFLRQLWTLV